VIPPCFQKALTASHFMDHLLALACVFGGGVLLIRRTAPLGIAMLAPVVVQAWPGGTEEL
jgi:hypothetical protein